MQDFLKICVTTPLQTVIRQLDVFRDHRTDRKENDSMASKTQHTELVRARKQAPNRENVKKDQKRMAKNLEILVKALSGK